MPAAAGVNGGCGQLFPWNSSRLTSSDPWATWVAAGQQVKQHAYLVDESMAGIIREVALQVVHRVSKRVNSDQ